MSAHILCSASVRPSSSEKSSARTRSSTCTKNEILVSWLGMKGLEPSTFCTSLDKLGLPAPKNGKVVADEKDIPVAHGC